MSAVTFWVSLGVFTATRAALLFLSGTNEVPASLWPWVFVKGVWFDVWVAGAAAAPAFVYETVAKGSWRRGPFVRRFETAWMWATVSCLLLMMAVEGVFWNEFSTRLNFIAVDYLLYTTEVLGNIRESYPLGLVLAAVGIGSAGVLALVHRVTPRVVGPGAARPRRGLRAAVGAAVLAGGLSAASIDQMEGSNNAYVDEISGNGWFTLAAALRRNELDYDKLYRTMPQSEADAVLQSLGVERVPLSESIQGDMFDEATDPLPFRRRPRNIVLISVESLSASFLGTYGSPKGWTPALDDLARRGLVFRNVFATGTRTVRGLEALSLGIPPVPGQSVVRRPDNDHLSTLGGVLRRQGYATFFIYGGYGVFDNMNAYFGGNDYDIVDRSRFSKDTIPFANIWGVADEALFTNTVRVLDDADRAGRPFFAHVMTTSNHRPFTYPDGRIDIPSPGGRAGAVKYTDHAIGAFLRAAATRRWFADTLFVITADHCASAAGKTKLPLRNYRIPLFFYGPSIVRPGVDNRVLSQIDLMPTLVEVLGRKGDDHFFGRSFFEPGPALERAFVSNYQRLGYFRDGILTILSPKQRVESYRVDPDTEAATPAPINLDRVNEAVAYYQTAARAFKRHALRLPGR